MQVVNIGGELIINSARPITIYPPVAALKSITLQISDILDKLGK